MARNPVSRILSSGNAITILLTSPSNILQQMGGRLNSQITKLLHELHFTNTFGLNHLINPIADSRTISMRLCSVETQIHRHGACCMIATTVMCGSIKFSLRKYDLDNLFFS